MKITEKLHLMRNKLLFLFGIVTFCSIPLSANDPEPAGLEEKQKQEPEIAIKKPEKDLLSNKNKALLNKDLEEFLVQPETFSKNRKKKIALMFNIGFISSAAVFVGILSLIFKDDIKEIFKSQSSNNINPIISNGGGSPLTGPNNPVISPEKPLEEIIINLYNTTFATFLKNINKREKGPKSLKRAIHNIEQYLKITEKFNDSVLDGIDISNNFKVKITPDILKELGVTEVTQEKINEIFTIEKLTDFCTLYDDSVLITNKQKENLRKKIENLETNKTSEQKPLKKDTESSATYKELWTIYYLLQQASKTEK